VTDQTSIPHDDTEPLFPKTQREMADEFLSHFQADVEKAEKSLITARRNLREAITLRDDAELNLKRAIEAEKVAGATESTAEEFDDGHLIEGEVEDAEIVEDEPPAHIDMVTGEVLDPEYVPEEPSPEDSFQVPDEALAIVDAEPERTPQVWVIWPNAEESINLPIGPLTRYGEIVANFLNANPDEDFLARYVITDAEGTTYDPKAVIGSENYGCEYFLEPELAVKKEA
jgi:hypothetical protein